MESNEPNSPKLLLTTNGFLTPIMIILASALMSFSIFFSLRSASVTAKSSSEVKGSNTSATNGSEASISNGVVSISNGDDPIIGDQNTAKVAIIEFTDYHCPFCKKFHDETFSKIKSDYLDSGKAIFIVKDLPLSIHEPHASNKANVAECVYHIGGTGKYFEISEDLYNTSGSDEKTFDSIISQAGINKDEFQSCYDNKTYKDEIKNDSQEASSIGITGTPGFVIGSINADGSVQGIKISGAQPYSVFQSTIDSYL